MYYKIKHRNGFNSQAEKQQILAIKRSGSSIHKLNEIKAQTPVIHGVNDPLIPIEHAKKYLKFHLDAKKYYIRSMGHDMSSPILKPMINKILNFLSN